MVSSVAKKSKSSKDEFVPMRRTRALLSETWELWRESFQDSPKIAQRVLMQGLLELHKAEKEIEQKFKRPLKQSALRKRKASIKRKTKSKKSATA